MSYLLVIFLFSLIDSFANEILNISKFKNLIAITFGCVFLNLIFIAYQFFYFSIKPWRLPVIKNHLLIWKLLMIFCIILQTFCSIHRKTIVLESLFNKVAGMKTCNFIEKNTYIEGHLRTAASVVC